MAPKAIPHKTPPEIEELVIAERKQHPTWGPKKLKEVLELRLERSFPSAQRSATSSCATGSCTPNDVPRLSGDGASIDFGDS